MQRSTRRGKRARPGEANCRPICCSGNQGRSSRRTATGLEQCRKGSTSTAERPPGGEKRSSPNKSASFCRRARAQISAFGCRNAGRTALLADNPQGSAEVVQISAPIPGRRVRGTTSDWPHKGGRLPYALDREPFPAEHASGVKAAPPWSRRRASRFHIHTGSYHRSPTHRAPTDQASVRDSSAARGCLFEAEGPSHTFRRVAGARPALVHGGRPCAAFPEGTR